MKRAVLADTGPLYAAADPDDEHHPRAQRELIQLSREKREVFVAYPTLFEAYTLVLFRLGNRTALHWLDEISSNATLINPTLEDHRRAASRIVSLADQSITLFDANTAAISERLNIPVWTYDYHFDLMRILVWR